MATIPRTYMITSKGSLDSIQPKNGQVIAVYDSDEVWYDAPDDGTVNGNPVRRKISGVRVVSKLPDPADPDRPQTPMEDIVYVNIGDNQGTLPSGDPLYTMYVWVNGAWYLVGSNKDDSSVATVEDTSGTKFLLVGTPENQDLGSLLKTPSVYVENNTIYANLHGTASYATDAGQAQNAYDATRAENDNATPPKPITKYLYSVVSNESTVDQSDWGSVLTFTLGNGSTTTAKVKDTKYAVYTENPNIPGLVEGIATTTPTDNTGLVLSGTGWIDLHDLSIPTSESAIKDGSDQVITSTYIKNLTFTGRNLNMVKGDGTSATYVTIPDTTYEVFDTTRNGLVPASSGAGEDGMFLCGDHQWHPVVQFTDIYVGATASTPGSVGLVPAAQSGELDKYLRGDGTWGTTFSQGVTGLVPAPNVSTATVDYSLRGNGTWSAITDTKNTAGAINDTTNKLYVIGATQIGNNPVTNANNNIYILNNKLYQYDTGNSATAEVVDVSSAQDLTNKTFDGQPLGSAAFANSAESMDQEETFTGDGTTTTFEFQNYTALAITNVEIDSVEIPDTDYTFDDENNTITFNTAPVDEAEIVISYTAYNPDDIPTFSGVSQYVSYSVNDIITAALSDAVLSSVLAPNYNDSSSYSVGTFCTNLVDGTTKLYRCNTAIPSGGEDFDPDHWDEKTVIEAIQDLISEI